MIIPPSTRASVRRALLGFYERSKRDLPFRVPQGKADPYAVWIAEVMLQQTRIETAIPYLKRFLVRFPSLESLSLAREEDVLMAFSGLGYYGRARRLGRAAREALEKHGGLPNSLEALRALPGFGPYTAGAVASIAFGIRAAAVDGNVARVLSRLFLETGDPGLARTRRRLEALASQLVPKGRPGDFNQALMDLGATICKKARPSCDRCPVQHNCRARAAGREREVPPARRRPARRELLVAYALDPGASELVLVRRPSRGLFGGLWDLPHAEVAPGRDSGVELGRALARLGVKRRVGEALLEVKRVLTHRNLTLRAHRVSLSGARFSGALRVHPREIERLGLPGATRALLVAAFKTTGSKVKCAKGMKRLDREG